MTSRSAPLLLDPRRKTLKTAEDVCELLEETMNRVRQGSLDPRAANTIGFLAGIHLKALAQRVEAPDPTQSLVYTALFDRMRSQGSPPPSDELWPSSDERVADLFPERTQEKADLAALSPLPAIGESIDEGTTLSPELPGVITIEVG